MSREHKFSYEPRPDEPEYVSQARWTTWIISQLTPDQLRDLLESQTGNVQPPEFKPKIVPDIEWRKAVVCLINKPGWFVLGIRLDQERTLETFTWEGITIKPKIISGEDDRLESSLLSIELESEKEFQLKIVSTNVQDTLGEEIRVVGHSGNVVFETPTLVEDIPAYLVTIVPTEE